jgi:hypothetical protein
MKYILILTTLLAALVLAGCATVTPHLSALDHYKNCAAVFDDLLDTISCGKESRNNYCKSEGICSSEGNSTVAWFDVLAEQLRMNVMTQAEAKLEFFTRIEDIETAHAAAQRQAKSEFARKMGEYGRQLQEQYGGGSSGGYGSSSQIEGRYSHYELNGNNKICYYSVEGSKRAVNQQGQRSCPNSWMFTN